jgi:hypothetical protein
MMDMIDYIIAKESVVDLSKWLTQLQLNIALRHSDGMTLQEIANDLGISLRKVRYNRERMHKIARNWSKIRVLLGAAEHA